MKGGLLYALQLKNRDNREDREILVKLRITAVRRNRTGIRCRVKSAYRKLMRLCFRHPAPVFSFILAAALLADMSSQAALFALGKETAAETGSRPENGAFSAEGGFLLYGRAWADPEDDAEETETEQNFAEMHNNTAKEDRHTATDIPAYISGTPDLAAELSGSRGSAGESGGMSREAQMCSISETEEGPAAQSGPQIDVSDELFLVLPEDMEADTEEGWEPGDDGCLTVGIAGSSYPFAWIPEDAVYPDYTEFSGIDLDTAAQIAAYLHMLLQFRAYASEKEAMQALLAGEVDLVMGGILLERYENPRLPGGLVKLGRWGEETEGIAFTRPYLSYQAVVLAKEEEPSVTMPYPFALQGKKAGVLSLFGEDNWTSHYDLPGSGITVYSSDWDALQALRYGEIDCIITGRRMASKLIRLQGGVSVQTGSRAVCLFEDHYVAAVRSEDEAFREKLSGAMESLCLKRRGGILMEEILRRYEDSYELPRYPAYRSVSPAVRSFRMRKLARTFSRKACSLLTDGSEKM